MTRSEQRFEFLKVMFDEHDYVAFGMTDAKACKPVDPIPSFLFTDAVKFCINPCKGWRDTDHVTAINALLFEMDKDPNGKIIPKETQIEMFQASGLPYTTLTWSGTKSVHCIVRFTEPIKDAANQKIWWTTIKDVLVSKGLFIDESTKAVPQLSRTPGSIRVETGQEQELIHINRRVSQSEALQWLQANGRTLAEPKPITVNTYVEGSNDHIKANYKWQRAVKMNEKKEGEYKAYASTGNHMWLFNYGIKCWLVDLDLESSIALAIQEWGHTYYTSANGKVNLGVPITKGWQFAQNKNMQQFTL